MKVSTGLNPKTLTTTTYLNRAILATAVSIACSMTASAQQSTADVKPSYDKLEEIIVTAQKREQSLIDVPISVTAINSELLSRSALTRLADYAAQVPGMSVTSATRGLSQVVLRGISTGISTPTATTAYYIDEAPIGSINAYARGSTITPDLDPTDLRRLEVLKGPQGTLYGAGAVGGLLRYVTKAPDTESFSGTVMFGGNSISKGGDGSEARLALNVPLVEDKVALRISALHRDEAGFIDNPINGQSDVNEASTQGGRVALLWNVNDDWSLQAWGLTQKFESDGLGAEDLNAPSLKPVGKELEHSSYLAETQTIELDVANVTVKGDIGNFSLVSSTTYQTVDAESQVDQTASLGALFSLVLNIPNLGLGTTSIIETERWSQELRLRSTAFDEALGYEVGLYYTNEDSANILPPDDPFLTTTGMPLSFGIPIADAAILSKYEEYSLFGNMTYAINSQFELLAGVRFSRDEQNYKQDYKLGLLTSVPTLFSQDVSSNNSTFLLSASYKPNENSSLYARVATGYRPGGPSALPPGVVPGVGQSFESDTLISYEVGYKAALLDGRASIESALFTTEWEDVQIQTSVQSPSGTYNYFVNGDTATSSGAEVTVSLLPIDGLTLRATASYTNSELNDDVPGVGGIDGDRMPFVPEWTGSLTADYRFALANSEAWIGGSINYIGDRVSNFSAKANTIDVPSYETYNFNAGVDFDSFTVTLYGKNLSDERGSNHITSIGLASPVNPRSNPFTSGVIQPRTVGIDVTYRF